MTEPKGSSRVLPEPDRAIQPLDHAPGQPSTDRREETTRKRSTLGQRLLWIVGLVVVGVILVIAVALTGSDSGLGPTAGGDPPGSDRHLENQAARVRAETGTVNGSDQHLENQAARARLQTNRAYGSDRHLENQAAPHPDAT